MSAAPARSDPLHAAAAAAEACGERAWLVGGAVRDRLLERITHDFDVVVAGDPAPLARAAARDAGGHAFELSESFGTWRVVARDRAWQLDVLGLAGATIAQDLARRDLTVNAIAQPLAADARGADPAALVDPFGGVADLAVRRLRMVGERSFADDPLRVLRLARFAAELGFAAEPSTLVAARESAPGLTAVAPERVFAELRAIVRTPRASAGLALMDELGATAVVLPELAALEHVEQSAYHHLDVAAHTRATLDAAVALTDDPAALGLSDENTAALASALAQPLANELSRGQVIRLAALLHDIAKPLTRAVSAEGRVTFMGHDARGAELAGEILGRLRAAERLASFVAALTRHHLALGFLVHRAPLSRRDVYDYLAACAPVGVDVTVLSVADRLATRGRGHGAAIDAHLALAREMLPAALRYEADPPRPAVRGDELATALGMTPGPRLGALLAELTAARFTGEAPDREAAVALARRLSH